MTASLSITSFLAVGLATPLPENKTQPAYFAEDFKHFYVMEQEKLNTYYHYWPDRTISQIIVFGIVSLISYQLGANLFDHANIDKAYEIVKVYINHFIEQQVSKQKIKNHKKILED